MKTDATPDDSRNAARNLFISTRDSFLAFIRYPRPGDLFSAAYSILFMVVASWWLKRIPHLPFTVLAFIPFVYLSALGIALLLAGSTLLGIFRDSRFKFLRKLFGEDGAISGFCLRDGEKFVHAAFGVGIFLLIGSIYYSLNYGNHLAWFLTPLILLGMVALFSLNQHLTGREVRGGLGMGLLRRCLYAIVLLLSLYGVYYIVSLPFKTS